MIGLLHIVMALAVMFSSPAFAKDEGIAAVVNSDAITFSDVEDRLKLMIVSSGMPYNDDIRNRLRAQVLNMLVDESLQVQEARAAGIDVTPEEIDSGFATIAKNNNMEADQFRSILSRSGIRIGTMRDQIRAQIAWGKVVQKKLRPQVDVTDRDIDERQQFLESSLGKSQYQLAEIFLPVETMAQDAETLTLAQRLVREIMQNKAPFQKVAAQFSQGASAARGGDLGWIQDGQLPDPLNALISSMNEGDLSQPTRSLTGYHILLLRGKRQIEQVNLPTRDQIMAQIGNERLDRLQRRYLMDLKAEAFVERRV
jgi:peptidyl-prolyl cis-trans isomerase SurA